MKYQVKKKKKKKRNTSVTKGKEGHCSPETAAGLQASSHYF